MRRRVQLSSAVAVALLAGCGSTAMTPEGAAGAPQTEFGSGPAGSSAEDLATSPDTAQQVGGRGPTRVDSGGTSSEAGTAGGTSSGTAVRGASVPGVTATTIRFGVAYTQSQGEANEALGAGGQDQGDIREYYNILASDMNKRGGVLGRALKPVYFDLDSASGSTTQQVYQQICEYFTKDHPVFVVFGLPDDLMRACVQKAGILLVADGGNSTTLTFQRFPNYFEVTSPRLERVARATVDGLASTDYFQRARNASVPSKPVLGLITWDESGYRRAVDHGYIPSLRQRRLGLTSTAYVPVPYADQDLSAMTAAISNAVLSFRQDGVTHVIIQDGPAGGCAGACLTLLWLKTAGSQAYYPRYGFNDSNSAKAGYDSGLWNAADVDDSRYITWADRDAYADSGVRRNTARESCLALLKSGGVTLTNETAKSYAFEACDVMRFLRAGLLRGPGRVDVAAMTAGVNALGASFAPSAVYATRFSAAQHDGAAAYRIQGFNEGAWRWLSGLKPMF